MSHGISQNVIGVLAVIGLDIQDDLGRHEVGFVDNVEKEPINDEEGCRFSANFKVNKVSRSLGQLSLEASCISAISGKCRNTEIPYTTSQI